jgi:hypothetical protein
VSVYGTKFVESEAILAAQAGDVAEVQRLAATMLPGELRELATACDRLLAEIRPDPGPFYIGPDGSRYERLVTPTPKPTPSTTGRP